MLYIVTYQLRPPLFRNEAQIAETLQQLPTQAWWHYMNHVWFLKTPENANELYNRIAPRFTQADSVLIVSVNRGTAMQGWLPKEAWEWINQQRANEWT